MAFIYEKTTQEDSKKFNLDQLWNNYHQGAFIRLPLEYEVFQHHWTVDKEQKIWLYDMTHFQQYWDGSLDLYLFYYNSKITEIFVKSEYIDDLLTYNIDFVSVNSVYKEEGIEELDIEYLFITESIDDLELKEIKTFLKKALIEYLTDRHGLPCIVNCRW